jgi:hypothetical protein
MSVEWNVIPYFGVIIDTGDGFQGDHNPRRFIHLNFIRETSFVPVLGTYLVFESCDPCQGILLFPRV